MAFIPATENKRVPRPTELIGAKWSKRSTQSRSTKRSRGARWALQSQVFLPRRFWINSLRSSRFLHVWSFQASFSFPG